MPTSDQTPARDLRRLVDIGIALAAERNLDRLLERILQEARALTGADAGTLYLLHDGALHFAIAITASLGVHMGGASGTPITWPPVPLSVDGQANTQNVCAYAALHGETLCFADVYTATGFDFQGTRRFDAGTGYRTQSMLVVPMRDHDQQVIGVLQLINAIDPAHGRVISFQAEDIDLLSALAAHAAVVIDNARLIRDTERLFAALVQVMASAIDERSPATAGHIRRVTDLTVALAEAVAACDTGALAGVRLSPEELDELRVAAYLHDVGKVTTPIHVVEKRTKLEAVFDRAELVRTRFEQIKATARAEALAEKVRLLQAGADAAALAAIDAELERRLAELEDDQRFVLAANEPVEFMPDAAVQRLHAIAAKTYVEDGQTRPYLTADELNNLAVQRGNITGDELAVMRDHAAVSIRLLEQIPFTRKLARVPEIAGAHHEKLNGRGYPRGLSGEQISLQSRMLAIADVYEALTAADRSYKRARTPEEAMRILRFMARDGELDAELVELFIAADVPARVAAD